MGLFDGLFGGSSPSNKYTEMRDNADALQGAYGGTEGRLGTYDADTYLQYRPEQIQDETNYIAQQKNIAQNGLDANTRAMLLGSYANGPGYEGQQANSAQDLSDFERGISPTSSTSEGARTAINNNTLGAYQQAMAQLGLTNYNAKVQARTNELNGYNNIVAPAQQGANNELGTAAQIEGNVGSAYDRSGQEYNEWQDQHSPGAAFGKLLGTAAQLYGAAHGNANVPAGSTMATPASTTVPGAPAGSQSGWWDGITSNGNGGGGGWTPGGVWSPSGDVGTTNYGDGTVRGVMDLG